MSRPRIGIALALITASWSSLAPGQQSARPKQPAQKQAQVQAKAGGNARPAVPLPAMTPEMEKLLAAWEAKSRELTTLAAEFERQDHLKSIGEESFYRGKAVLQAPNLAYLDFCEVHKNGVVDGITERIVCDGVQVLQYVADAKQILVWPLAKEARNRALEEGPLPFLFNMKADEVKKRYAMRRLPDAASRPNHYLIEIVPKLAVDQDAFLNAYIFLDKATYLPSDIKLMLPNKQDDQVYIFNNKIVANPKVDPKTFAFVKFKGWAVVFNPGPGGNANAPAPAVGPIQKQAGANKAGRFGR